MRHAGQSFWADIEWSWGCNKNRDIYTDDGQGGSIPVAGQKGCGARYYMGGKSGIPRGADGKYPLRIVCGNPECGALIRAFANLTNFHPAE